MKNKVKQILSVAMTVCMLSTMVPLTTYGAEVEFSDDTDVAFESEEDTEETTTDAADVQIEEGEQTDENADVSVEEDAEDTDEENAETGDEQFTSDEGEAGTEELFSDSVGTKITAKPADGTTTGQPFPTGTGGSQNFRIPAMVTLSDGTIVAATDARWNTTSDGYGLDTIVSRSSDNGATWNYTFANYLGDNGNAFNDNSTAFIDPVLAVGKDGTIYMMVDLFPTGGYIGNISSGTGYNSDGYLKLSTSGNSGSSSYDYYLNGSAIYNAKTNEAVSGLNVDDHFNLTGTYNGTTYNTNLFFADSPFKVLKTSYLYLTKSTDGGKTWSAPQMLNSQVKSNSEPFYGVGPGRGLTTTLEDGTERIILPCYTYNNYYDQHTSVIYSDDHGASWSRSNSMSPQSSEATLVEAGENIYMFTRGGGYYVSSDHGATWSGRQSISGISYNTNCQINAITYSQKIDGKTAILLSAPSNTGSRTNGKIFVGLVQDDGSIQWKYSCAVNSGTYQYSCMTELKDGTVALLYENGEASEYFTVYKIDTLAPGATIGTKEESESTITDETTGVKIHFLEEKIDSASVSPVTVTEITNDPYIAYDVVPGEGYSETSAEVTIPLNEILKGLNVKAFYVNNGKIEYVDGKKDGGNYVFTVPHFTVVGVQGSASNGSDELLTTEKVTLAVNTSRTFAQDGEYSYTDSDECVNVKTEVKDKNTDPYYVSAAFGTGTFYVSGTSGATKPTNTLTFENAGNGQYYVKNADGEYIYPYATYSWRNGWSCSLRKGQTTVDIVENNDGSITISKGYSDWYSGSTTAYLDSALSASENSSNIYLYSKVTPTAGKQTAITFTGTQIGTTEITIGNVRYEITVVTRGGSYDTSVAVGSSKDIAIPDTIGADEKVVWSSGDYTKAGVYSSDGQKATITGREEGTTVVTATVYDKDGEQAAVYSWNVNVTEGEAPNAGNYTITFNSSNKIYNGKLYYSIAGGSLVEVPVAETTTDEDGNTLYKYDDINVTVTDVAYTQLELFVKPDEGYAVTSVTDETGTSYSQFYGIDKENVQVVYSDGHQGAKLEAALTTEQEKAILSEAIANGCDAVWWYTRTASGTNESSHTVHCDKLPTIEKEMDHLRRADGTEVEYTEGMVAHKGDTAVFKITVNKYKESVTEKNAGIAYTNVLMTDKMENIKLYSDAELKNVINNPYDLTTLINKTDGVNAATHIYYAAYTITEKDLDKEFINTVDLSYNYSSTYSTGTYGGSATDNAKFIATNFPGIKDIVVDYGLPVNISVGKWESAAGAGKVTVTGISEKDYADVTVSGDNTTGINVTYTPKHVLESVDTVVLTATSGDGKNNVEYSFKVYPATTVYYEESFVDGGAGAAQLSEQKATEVGSAISENQNYGCDVSYEVSGEVSGPNLKEWKNGTIELGTDGPQTFRFNGTGVDIYADTEAQDDEDDHDFTGTMMIKVKDEANQLVKIVAVDTRMKNGTSKATSIQNVNGKNVPVATLELASKGEYTLTLSRVKSGSDGLHPVYLDGFRVYNTLGNSENAVYAKDGEANPTYYELRDQVISTIAGENKNISDKYAEQIAKDKLGQVYAEGKVTNGAVVIEKPDTSKWSVTNIQDFVDNGPKNELYLDKNMAVTFDLTQDVQIGIKGVNGNAIFNLNGNSKQVSTTDMFYKVEKGQIIIENTGDALLSITKIKAIGGVSPIFLFAPLTEESLTAALVSLGYEKAPDPTATPTVKPTQKPSQQIKLATPKLGKVVSAGYNALKLNWSKVKGADGYRVYVKVNGQWKSLGDVKGTTYVHKHLETGKSYTFTVKAYKKTKSGIVWSSYDKKGVTGKVTLSAPSLRKAKRISAKKATLSWKKVDGANGYVVYRKTNNGRWQIIKKITKGSTTSFTDTKLSKGKKYTYTVRAYRTVGKKNVYSGYNAKGLTVK